MVNIPLFTGFHTSQVVGLGISEPSPIAPNRREPCDFNFEWLLRKHRGQGMTLVIHTFSGETPDVTHVMGGGNTQVSTSTKTDGLEHQN